MSFFGVCLKGICISSVSLESRSKNVEKHSYHDWEDSGYCQMAVHLFCKFRITFTQTKIVEMNSYHDWEFSGSRQMVIIIIIIIAFKGTIRDFVQSPHSAANCLQHVRLSGPGATMCKSPATHRALITCKCHVTCHLVRRDSSAIKFDRVEIAFIWALFHWLMKEGRKPEYPEKTPGDKLQKMPHTTARRFKPQARLKPTQ